MDTPTDCDFLQFVEPEPEERVEPVKPTRTDTGIRFSPVVPEMLTVREVCALVKVSRSTLYAWLKAGQFPKPVRVGGRSVRWFEDDIVGWQSGLQRADYGAVEQDDSVLT